MQKPGEFGYAHLTCFCEGQDTSRATFAVVTLRIDVKVAFGRVEQEIGRESLLVPLLFQLPKHVPTGVTRERQIVSPVRVHETVLVGHTPGFSLGFFAETVKVAAREAQETIFGASKNCQSVCESY